MWGLDVAIVNSYILYKIYHQMHDLEYMSHYRFRGQIFLAWIDSDQYWPTRNSIRKRSKVVGPGEGSTLKNRKREYLSSLSSLSIWMTQSSTSSLVPNQASGKNKNCTTLTL